MGLLVTTSTFTFKSTQEVFWVWIGFWLGINHLAGQGREHSAEVWGKIDGFWSLMTHKTSAVWDVWLEETDTAWISPEQSTPGAWRSLRCHSLEIFKKYLYGLDGIFHLEEPPLWREGVHTPARTTHTG